MRRRLLNSISEEIPVIKSSNAETCDVVFANKSTNEVIIVRDWSVKVVSPNKWEPIGVVVIPGSHGVLKAGGTTNQCGIISLVPMNCSTPQTGGSSEQYMYWGEKTDISSLTNYNKAVITLNSNSNVANELNSSASVYIPKQASTSGKINRFYSPYAPSPYAGDDMKSGSYNESYGTTKFDTVSDFNALADFDGLGNTKKIIAQRGNQDYSSWKPTNDLRPDYPAASCCDMFSTRGTKQGDWYLPAVGELGYIIPRFGDINSTIFYLNSAYGIGVQLVGSNYWSSSEYSSDVAHTIVASSGNVRQGEKATSCYTRAFMRL